MNLSLNELINTINSQTASSLLDKPAPKSQLDITNLDTLDGGDSDFYDAQDLLIAEDMPNSIKKRSPLQAGPSAKNDHLDHNSSTDEFRKYLDDLKKNYLDKLSFSCPSKVTAPQDAESKLYSGTDKLKSSENVMNLIKKARLADQATDSGISSSFSARRSLFFDQNSGGDKANKLYKYERKPPPPREEESEAAAEKADLLSLSQDLAKEHPELTNTQILSRLMQIREYLKQAYTMLSTLQESNDLVSYASQMNKLHSLIDHLKDQEKGYMDLLDSFSKFQQLTKSLYSDTAAGKTAPNVVKDLLDLSELNESVYQQQQKQQLQQNELLKRKRSSDGKHFFFLRFLLCPFFKLFLALTISKIKSQLSWYF